MPGEHGIQATKLHNPAPTFDGPISAPELRTMVSDFLPALPFQIDFTEAVCTTSGANGLSVPGLLTTVVNFLNGAGIIIGAIMVLGVGVMAYGFDKSSATKGGGGAKRYIVGGGAIFVGGVLAYTIPAFVEQSLDGGGSCFAMIAPSPELVDAAAMVVATGL